MRFRPQEILYFLDSAKGFDKRGASSHTTSDVQKMILAFRPLGSRCESGMAPPL
jgi:hypothetical protein